MSSLETATARGPVHAELVANLSAQIVDGVYADGDRIPVEGELARRYGISVRSVRAGIDKLVEEGFLVRRQGSGTYVTNGRPRQQAAARTATVAMVLPLRLRGYHPFFSELLRGIREGISGTGKQVLELHFGGHGYGEDDVQPVNWARDRSLGELHACRDLAGIVCGASVVEELLAGLRRPLPVVAVDPTPAVPYVAYDWHAELDQAVLRQVGAGARRIWVYGAAGERPPPLVPADVAVRYCPGVSRDRGLLSAHIRHAYEEATAVFTTWEELDGVVVGSDFEAQGVLDAAVKCRVQAPDRVRFTCIVNRESRLVLPFPMTLLVADGYRKGRRVAELLDAHLRGSTTRPQRITMRCEEEYVGDR